MFLTITMRTALLVLLVALFVVAVGPACLAQESKSSGEGIPLWIQGEQVQEKAVKIDGDLFVPLTALGRMPGLKANYDVIGNALRLDLEPLWPPPRTVIFEDDFKERPDLKWEIISGEWVVSNSRWYPLNLARGASALVLLGSVGWTDYAIDLDVETPEPSEVWLYVRYANQDNWLGLRYEADVARVSWYQKKQGKVSEPIDRVQLDQGSDRARLLSQGSDRIHLRIEVRGDQVSAVVSNSDSSRWTCSGFARGKTGFAVMCPSYEGTEYTAKLDRIKVTALGPGE